MIKAEGVSKAFGDLVVLKEVSLEIQPGEVVAIVGPSGAGKTTLLQIIGTLEKPDRGKVWFSNTEVFRLDQKELAAFRNRKIGFIFQFHQLLPEFTAAENICIPAWISGQKKETSLSRAMELLELMGLSARASHKPAELSGGEAQRVAVARALMNHPEVILADEPSGNLDSTNARDLHQLFFRLRNELGQTFVIVTHNEELASSADRVIKMRDGRIIT